MIFLWSNDGGPLQYLGLAVVILQLTLKLLPLLASLDSRILIATTDTGVAVDGTYSIPFTEQILTSDDYWGNVMYQIMRYWIMALQGFALLTLVAVLVVCIMERRQLQMMAIQMYRDIIGTNNNNTTTTMMLLVGGVAGASLVVVLELWFVVPPTIAAASASSSSDMSSSSSSIIEVLFPFLESSSAPAHLICIPMILQLISMGVTAALILRGFDEEEDGDYYWDMEDKWLAIDEQLELLPTEKYGVSNKQQTEDTSIDTPLLQNDKATATAAETAKEDATTTTTVVRHNNNDEDSDDHDDVHAGCCIICCEDYVPEDTIRRLPSCHHVFHADCLDQWAYSFCQKRRRDPTCPLCNQRLFTVEKKKNEKANNSSEVSSTTNTMTTTMTTTTAAAVVNES